MTAAAAFCLLLPLWLGSCVPAPGESGSAGGAQPPAAAPAPEPAPTPSPATSAEAPAPGGSVQSSGAEPGAVSGMEPGSAALPPQNVAPPVPPAGAGQGSTGQPGGGQGGAGSPGAAEEPVSGPAPQGLPAAGTPATPPRAGQAPATGTGGAAAGPAPGAGAPGSGGSGAAGSGGAGSGGQTGSAEGTAVYYVALDDGGSSGVRFGCNDSLVPVHHADPVIREPLQAAMSRLLSEGAAPAGLYNALSSSALQYVSGYLDGATVVVNLTGAVQPGGTCDIPRIDAQLTHTAVTAAGAIRAEIYVDGVRLADVLSLR